MNRPATLVAALMMVFASCTGSSTSPSEPPSSGTAPTTPPRATSTAVSTPPTSTPVTTGVTLGGLQPRLVDAFAEFHGIPLIVDVPPYGGPTTPTTVEGIFVAPAYQRTLDDLDIETLERQGFVIVPDGARLLHPVYQTFPYTEGEVYFVTTDAGYHYLHLAFSKILRDLEEQELLPILEELLIGLVDGARQQRDALAGTELAEPADRVAQLYEAAATLADLDVGPIGALAQEEVELGLEAAQLTASPITGLGESDPMISMEGLVDYSLFQPRGHYTRSKDLERYFRGMSLLGNEAFVVDRADTMQLAALATRVLVEDADLLEAWQHIYEPTAFLVGLADDYSPLELAGQLDELAPGWRENARLLTRPVAHQAGAKLVDLRPIGIDPENASVRIMGVRFVVDSYLYDQLRDPNVPGRRYATPLDLVAAMGSELAYEIMETFEPIAGEGALTDPRTGDHWPDYDAQLDRLTALLAERQPADWATTVYDLWLYALEPVWTEHGDAYPDFMQTTAWETKDLQTGLGSYAELKHDTVLYAKQSFAPEGEFSESEFPEPRHWVEPNPIAFERMKAVADLAEAGLSARNLLPEGSDNARLIDALQSFLDRLGRLALDELHGRAISAGDNQWLGSIGSTMEALWIQSADEPEEPGGDFPAHDTHSALIADIMRTTFHHLEIGTGYFDSIFVLVPADDGRFQVARGGVYSYYEFWRDADRGRLTDEEWWDLLATDPPGRPDWQSPLFGSPPRYDTGLRPNEDCRTLEVGGHDYRAAVAYWLAHGRPASMDWDDNGIPCDVGSQIFDPIFFSGLPAAGDLFCRDLEPMGHSFAEAVAYWLAAGAPDRMDADLNGIPCETVYPPEEIESFFRIGGSG